MCYRPGQYRPRMMYQIIETFSEVFQRLKPNDLEQVKAGVAYAASPADHIGRQSRPFRRSLVFSLGELLKGRPFSSISEKLTRFDKEKPKYLL